MFYVKNALHRERSLCLTVGMAALALAAHNCGSAGSAIGAGIVGGMFAMTGVAGLHPMCAVLGRKLGKRH